MVGIAHKRRYRADERKHQHHEQQRCESYRHQCCRVNLLRILAFLVGEAEEGGLHSVCENHHQQCRIGIYVGDDAIASTRGRQFCRVQRYKQIIKKSAYDAAKTVNGGVLSKGFEICHIELLLLFCLFGRFGRFCRCGRFGRFWLLPTIPMPPTKPTKPTKLILRTPIFFRFSSQLLPCISAPLFHLLPRTCGSGSR